MTDRDQIIAWAREAGFRAGTITLSTEEKLPFIAPISAADCMHELLRFASLVAAHEREQCARVCEAEAAFVKSDNDGGHYAASNCAAAIRGRAEK